MPVLPADTASGSVPQNTASLRYDAEKVILLNTVNRTILEFFWFTINGRFRAAYFSYERLSMWLTGNEKTVGGTKYLATVPRSPKVSAGDRC